MKRTCPNPDCQSTHIIKKGYAPKRMSDGYKARKFLCKSCGQRFSSATSDPCFGQKKRHLNDQIDRLLASGMSRNNIARFLGIHRRTVQRRIEFLGKLCKSKNDKLLAEFPPVPEVQFDEMETFEHTKMKPLSVALAVDRATRVILGIEVSQIPANGPLAAKSVEKYGYRRDERRPAMCKMLAGLTPLLADQVHFESDKATWYPQALSAVFGSTERSLDTKDANLDTKDANMDTKNHKSELKKVIQYKHTTYKGRKSCITGQGELKKGKDDPLFPLNHTAAMIRYNMSRMIRRTWCTTKKVEYLIHHLNIYAYHHNLNCINEQKKKKAAEDHPQIEGRVGVEDQELKMALELMF